MAYQMTGAQITAAQKPSFGTKPPAVKKSTVQPAKKVKTSKIKISKANDKVGMGRDRMMRNRRLAA